MKTKIFLFATVLLFLIGCEANRGEINNNMNEDVKNIKAFINDTEYIINLEDNETAKKFIEFLPLELNMSELNGNEKYIYLDT